MDVEQARQKASEIIDRLSNDPQFAVSLRNDPTGTLRGAGLPDQAIGEFMDQVRARTLIGAEAEVSGYVCSFLSIISSPPLSYRTSGCGETVVTVLTACAGTQCGVN
jgi:hypothetical protein